MVMGMADHDFVVMRIALYHFRKGDEVYADASGLRGFPKPPTYEGSRGGTYRPDVYIRNKDIIYEVEPYGTLKNQIHQIKAFFRANPRKLIVVLSSGTEKGVPRIRKLLEKNGIKCRVMNYRELPFWNC